MWEARIDARRTLDRAGCPRCLAVAVAIAAFLLLAAWSAVTAQEGALETIREDVRTAPAASNSEPSHRSANDDTPADFGDDGQTDSDPLCLGILYGVVVGATSPFWGPPFVLGDDLSSPSPGYFSSYPYDHTRGFMFIDSPPKRAHCWGGRLDVEYIESFEDVHIFGGQLLIDTASRFGIDASLAQLEERLSNADRDRMEIGDANLVFRFAQSPKVQFRSGLGVNWLHDDRGDDLGFNFTYGADLFPKRPWVVTSAIDWGTLGHAELFRFRATAGVVVNRFEIYTGYQYLDIGRTELGSLIGGLRLWF